MPTTPWCGWNHRRENAFPQTIIHSIIHKKTASPLPVPPPAQTELLRGFPPRQPKTLRDGGPGAETFLRKTPSPGSLLRSISSGGQEGSFRGRWNSPALGLALDGTGYGTDGTIWGGELLFVDPKSAGEERYGGRIGRLAPFPLPGGEAAIREPWRIASGFMGLPEAEGLEGFVEDMDALFGVDGKHAIHDAILEMVRRKATPMTSSCGRLFDAVSALLGLCPSITYEGQAAIRLEAHQDLSVTMAVPFSIKERGGLLELDTAAFFLHLLELRRTGVSVPDLARRFHLGLAEGLADLALSGARRCGVRTVALSGGVFHNRTIALLLPEALARRGLVPLTHHALPPGDGGLSYGQAAWASHVLR